MTDTGGIGRWVWYMLEGDPGHKTYVVPAYVPYGTINSERRETVIQQQLNYIQEHRLLTDTKKMFQENMLTLLIW